MNQPPSRSHAAAVPSLITVIVDLSGSLIGPGITGLGWAGAGLGLGEFGMSMHLMEIRAPGGRAERG